ncbi:hypothetical protein GQX74_002684 [Glossina fuscipes]|nr:hypothetical protein GQX74_002684 [Glossina fuscipes]
MEPSRIPTVGAPTAASGRKGSHILRLKLLNWNEMSELYLLFSLNFITINGGTSTSITNLFATPLRQSNGSCEGTFIDELASYKENLKRYTITTTTTTTTSTTTNYRTT